MLRILPSIQRSVFLADSMRVSTKSESECLTPPAGLNWNIGNVFGKKSFFSKKKKRVGRETGNRNFLVRSKGPSQKFAEACEAENVSLIINPSLPTETNWNRKTSFNVPMRSGSADFDFPDLGKKKLVTQELLANIRPLKNGKSQTMQKKKGRVGKEKSAYPSSSPFDRASQNTAERGVHSLRAANFFFFWSLLYEDGRDPLPRKRTLFV